MISRGLGVYEADGDGDDANEEGEDCLDSGDLPPVAIAVRDSVRGTNSNTTAHGALTTDGRVTPVGITSPPLFGKNTTSTHSDASLFRSNSPRSGRNNTGSPSPTTSASRSSARSPSGRPRVELNRGDMFSDSSRMDDTLQCPRCKQEYPTQNHADFLDHVDKCCD